MNAKKILSILLIIVGEGLIITCFLYFGSNLSRNILTLNIVISSIIYLLYFIDVFFPLVDFKDKSQKTIGSLGLRWLFTFLYTIIAIGAMVLFTIYKPFDVNGQIIIHGILFFFLLFGLYFAISSSNKVNEVFQQETGNRSRVDDMKKVTKDLQVKMEQTLNIPSDLKKRVSFLLENIRYISPSNTEEAIELESNYLKSIKSIQDCLYEVPLNIDSLTDNLNSCERIYNDRKQVYSK
jgi:hypothetical protein